jgi:hypothetical protein
MDATWRSLATLCRELDWSRPRLLHELRNGLRYRTFPPGHAIDWHDSNVERSLDVEASQVAVLRGVFGGPGVGFDRPIVGIEVLPPTEATTASPSARWVIATVRELQAEKKIPEGATKAEVARVLEAEAQKAVQAGQLSRVIKASYLENQLAAWGIWPLGSFR